MMKRIVSFLFSIAVFVVPVLCRADLISFQRGSNGDPTNNGTNGDWSHLENGFYTTTTESDSCSYDIDLNSDTVNDLVLRLSANPGEGPLALSENGGIGIDGNMGAGEILSLQFDQKVIIGGFTLTGLENETALFRINHGSWKATQLKANEKLSLTLNAGERFEIKVAVAGHEFLLQSIDVKISDFAPLPKAVSHLFILAGGTGMVGIDSDTASPFLETVRRVMPSDKITAINNSQLDAPISLWDNDAPMWTSLINAIDTVSSADKSFDYVTLLWMNGEKDSESIEQTNLYQTKLLDLYTRLKSHLAVNDLYFVIGRLDNSHESDVSELGGNWRSIRALQEFVGDTRNYAAWVDTDDLNRTDKDELAKHLANAATELIQYNLEQKEVHRMPLHFTYGGSKKKLIQSDEEILAAFDERFGPGNYPTQLNPVVLNVDPAKHHDFIVALKERVPYLFFGVGHGNGVSNPTNFPEDWDKFMGYATAMRKYSDCIRVEVFDNILEHSGGADPVTGTILNGEEWMLKMLYTLNKMGFKRIMLNPWIERPSDPTKPWPFVDSVFIGTGSNKVGLPTTKIRRVYDVQPDAVAILNYENQGMHLKLKASEEENPGSTIDAASTYNVAVLAERQALKDSLGDEDTETTPFKWCPPWSINYDPLGFGTLEWIADKLIELNPPRDTHQQNLSLNLGYNLISPEVNSCDIIASSFEADDLKCIESVTNAEGREIDPGNTMWDSSTAFMIKLSPDFKAGTITIIGTSIGSASLIKLSRGNSLLPVFSTKMNALEVFAPLLQSDKVKVIRSEGGQSIRFIDGVWINGIGNITNGQSYVISLTESFSFSYR